MERGNWVEKEVRKEVEVGAGVERRRERRLGNGNWGKRESLVTTWSSRVGETTQSLWDDHSLDYYKKV